ncbi:MAG: FmdB family zinc ribbon protein [Gammaproteobacteria bacterium]
MPIYQLHCPHCGHRFNGMVFAGSRLPEQWVCPECGSKHAELDENCPPVPHPLEARHGGGCPCCGGPGQADSEM